MKVEDCLTSLADADESHAKAKALMKGLEYQIKTIEAREMLKSKQGSAADRQAESRSSIAYQEITEKYQNAVLDYESLNNQRNTWAMGFEYWRSNNANRRQAGGNL